MIPYLFKFVEWFQRYEILKVRIFHFFVLKILNLPPKSGTNTPNANMADHSDGPGLVAWKRGQSVCQSRLFPNVLIIANGCMCSD